MDRRTFIAAGAWFSTAAWSAPWPDLADLRRAIVLCDSSLANSAASVALKVHAAREGLPTYDLADPAHADVGALWYATLAPRVASAPATLIGVTRSADFFVLARLALRPGRIPVHPGELIADSAVSFAIAT